MEITKGKDQLLKCLHATKNGGAKFVDLRQCFMDHAKDLDIHSKAQAHTLVMQSIRLARREGSIVENDGRYWLKSHAPAEILEQPKQKDEGETFENPTSVTVDKGHGRVESFTGKIKKVIIVLGSLAAFAMVYGWPF